jgi:hypothetical protein
LKNVPDDVEVNAEVIMDEPIAHPRHGPPFDLWMRLASQAGADCGEVLGFGEDVPQELRLTPKSKISV